MKTRLIHKIISSLATKNDDIHRVPSQFTLSDSELKHVPVKTVDFSQETCYVERGKENSIEYDDAGQGYGVQSGTNVPRKSLHGT